MTTLSATPISSPNQSGLPPAVADRNALIMEFYPMVRRVAYRMVKRFPRCVDVEDLVHIGLLGLIEAVERFDDRRAPSFAGYARMRVQGAIIDEMRKTDWVPRSVRDRAKKLRLAREQLSETLGRPPKHDELATFMGVDEERLNELIRTADVRTLVSTEEGDDDEGTVGQSLSCPKTDVHQDVDRIFLSERVQEAVRSLSEREQVIVDLYYYQDLTFKEISDVLGVTESRVSQLHTRLKKRIREDLVSLA
jgi:RNA polymerase sigma factor for flagellar operon FliA